MVEIYKSITRQKPIQFNRFLLGRSQIGSNNGSVKVGVESSLRTVRSIPTQPIWSLSLGYYYSLFDSLLRALMMRFQRTLIKPQSKKQLFAQVCMAEFSNF